MSTSSRDLPRTAPRLCPRCTHRTKQKSHSGMHAPFCGVFGANCTASQQRAHNVTSVHTLWVISGFAATRPVSPAGRFAERTGEYLCAQLAAARAHAAHERRVRRALPLIWAAPPSIGAHSHVRTHAQHPSVGRRSRRAERSGAYSPILRRARCCHHTSSLVDWRSTVGLSRSADSSSAISERRMLRATVCMSPAQAATAAIEHSPTTRPCRDSSSGRYLRRRIGRGHHRRRRRRRTLSG